MFDDLIKLVGCTTERTEEGTTLWYDGSLDDFIERWRHRPVMINKEHGYIAVTQHHNFGQR